MAINLSLTNQRSSITPAILMYFLKDFCQDKKIPKNLIDPNLKTDIKWIRRLTASNAEKTKALVDQLSVGETIGFDDSYLQDTFNVSQIFTEKLFSDLILLFGHANPKR